MDRTDGDLYFGRWMAIGVAGLVDSSMRSRRICAARLPDRLGLALLSVRVAGNHPEMEYLISRLERKRGHLDLAGKHLHRSAALGLDRDRVRREELLVT